MKIVFSLLLVTLTTLAQPLESVLSPAQYEKAVHAIEHPGDPTRGASLFNDKARVGCTLCHQVFGREIHKPAPNLFGIGDKFTTTELIRAIEKPSAFILPGFETTQITSKDGDVFMGVLRSVSTKSGYSLTDAGNKTHKIRPEEVAKRETLKLSLMPEGLTAGLNHEEYSDLIAFLMAQKTSGMSGLAGKEAPADIVILEKPITLTPFHSEAIEFVAPVFATLLPGTDNEFLIIEHQAGKIWHLAKTESREQKRLFLDISNERTLGADSLVGIAFHPEFMSNRRYFIKYNAKESDQLKTIIEERIAAKAAPRDSGNSGRRLLEVNQPAGNHNGGHITFGPDRYLYTAFGDGGPQKDPNGHSQNLSQFLGAMLRIDVDKRTSGLPYAIPSDNPFAKASRQETGILPEIWAYGFREPWQFSFDEETGDLWLGDVGQVTYEEVSIVRKGENHGWNVYEGFHEFSDQYRRNDTSFTNPIFAYTRKLGTSITGGQVYRGDKNSPLYGFYICGDHESRRLFALKQKNRKLVEAYELGFSPQRISAFAADAHGELYLLGYQGTLFHLNLRTIQLTPR